MDNNQQKSIMVFDERRSFQRLIGLNAYLYLGRNIVFENEIENVVKYLKNNKAEVGLVLSNIGKDNMAEKLRGRLTLEGHKIPIIAIKEDKNGSIFNKESLKDLMRASAIILNINARTMVNSHLGEMYSISADLLPYNTYTNCPIYIKGHEGDYRLFLRSNEIITQEKILHLKNSTNEVFVCAKERLRLGNFFTQQLLKIIQNEEIPLEQKSSALDSSQRIIQDHARKIGIDDETLEWAKLCIDELCNEIVEIPKVSSYFVDKILDRPLSYRYRSSFLTNCIAIHMLKQSDHWSKILALDLTSACFMKDLALSKDDYIKIRSVEELSELRITKAEKRTIEFHSRVAYEYLKEVDYFSEQCLEIVKAHHGSLSGIGFNKSIELLNPIVSSVLLAEEWTHFVLNFENRPIALSRDKIISYLKKKYCHCNFIGPFEWLKNLTL